MIKHAILLFNSLLILAAPTEATPLDFGKLNPHETALYIRNLDNGKVLLAHRADTSMNPASTMKLLTTFAAFRALGSEYRWRTEWRSNASKRNGTLYGDLYWIGSGDPVFDHADLISMQNQLLKQGIGNLNGRIVLDSSIWTSQDSADGFENDSGRIFTTPPSPHLLAYNLLSISISTETRGHPAFQLDPPLHIHTDTSAVNWIKGTCGSLNSHLTISWTDNALTFTGKLPESCAGNTVYARVPDSQRFTEESFRSHWTGQDSLIRFTSGKTPADSVLLANHESKPLAAVLTDMNKFSNNIIARTVFLTLGQQESSTDNSTNGEAAIRRQLAESGVDDETLILENGSGLSRRERASARLIGETLTQAYRAPWRNHFIATLPIGGRDGTLRQRFQGSKGSLHLKTGTLHNVRALAGYRLQTGKVPLAVVAIVNGARTTEQLADLDAFILRAIRTADALASDSAVAGTNTHNNR